MEKIRQVADGMHGQFKLGWRIQSPTTVDGSVCAAVEFPYFVWLSEISSKQNGIMNTTTIRWFANRSETRATISATSMEKDQMMFQMNWKITVAWNITAPFQGHFSLKSSSCAFFPGHFTMRSFWCHKLIRVSWSMCLTSCLTLPWSLCSGGFM